ncbi:DUF6912 family protein [Devriesea agamarum]|uniref:DUF6912 family protein n=1 Tax=Devriesea agamarum TaxID=472569 RepID=UPI00071CFB36|nr:hypothetical protein [Devriesea agamarum]
MRCYVALPATDDNLPTGQAWVLPDHHDVYALTAARRAEQPNADRDDLEYDVQLDAVHAAVTRADRARIVLVTVDLKSSAILHEPGRGEAGAGLDNAVVQCRAGTVGRILSLHVTELGARAIDQDDVEPALLWFDATELDEALQYARSVPASSE